MSVQTKQKTLHLWIKGALESGIGLTEAVLDYLEATFGSRDLPGVLADADDCEIDSMLELLFYPDAALQVKFEERWGRESFSESNKAAVTASLCAAAIKAAIVLPDSERKISIAIPDFIIGTFVQRLNICWQPPAGLVAAMETYCLGESGLMTRVQLRNARLNWHEAQLSLMSCFLSQMPASSKTFEPDLDFLISILGEMKPENDAYTFLVNKKFFYFQSLCSAEDFERRRLSSNMEIMMMSGARAAHGSIAQWRQCMRKIDRICQALFGRTQFFQQPDSHCIDINDDMQKGNITRLLS